MSNIRVTCPPSWPFCACGQLLADEDHKWINYLCGPFADVVSEEFLEACNISIDDIPSILEEVAAFYSRNAK